MIPLAIVDISGFSDLLLDLHSGPLPILDKLLLKVTWEVAAGLGLCSLLVLQ